MRISLQIEGIGLVFLANQRENEKKKCSRGSIFLFEFRLDQLLQA